MSIEYSYIAQEHRLNVSVKGVLDSKDIIEYMDAITEESEIKEFVEVVDFSGVVDLVVRYSDVLHFSRAASQWAKKEHKVSILYVPTLTSQKIVGFMRPLLKQANVVIHVCETEDKLEMVISRILSE